MNDNILTLPVERDFLRKKRVAVYARVSTLNSEQETSYELQVKELIKLVKENPSHELVCVFADKESGKSSNRRSFSQLVELVRADAIDLVITKAISRFGRNLIEVVSLIREFKTHGCEIYFEKENISTYDAQIELTLNIMSAVAEEESRQISSNTAWSITKKMREGKNTTTRLYGYSIVGDVYVIIPEQASIVRQIFDWYLNGVSYLSMIERLEQMDILSPLGNAKWNQTTIEDILRNEKYTGDMFLRKFRHGKTIAGYIKNNTDSVKQFYVENHHDPIISRSVYDAAQAQRQSRRLHYNGESQPLGNPYSKYFFCKELDRYFTFVVERPKDKYEIPTLRATGGKERRIFHLQNMLEGIMLAVQTLVKNSGLLTGSIMANAAPDIEMMNNQLIGLYGKISELPVIDQLERYSVISDILIRKSRLGKLKTIVQSILRSARKLQDEFSMDTLKKVFSSCIVNGHDVYLIMDISGSRHREIPKSSIEFDRIVVPLVHRYKSVDFTFHVLIDSGSTSHS